MLNINQRISGLTPYQPGKPIEELTRELGITDVVKLASNENPRGPGPLVRQALKGAVNQLERYPDGNGFLLKRALAKHLEVAEECITLGNGSNDVLDLAARVALSPGSEAIVDEHCFLVYPMVVTGAGGVLVTIPSKNWRHDLGAMQDRVNDVTRIVFIANPNNPTGTWVSEIEISDFLAAVPQSVWVVLDEAYFDYVSTPGYPDGVRLQKTHPNLVVTRTFSKIHALAGLRVGYSVSTPQFADLMNRIRQPFNTSSLALAAAEAALEDRDFVSVSKKMNDAGMTQLISGFDALGIDYIPSVGNFVTFDCASDAVPVYNALLRHGVIVRPLANYRMSRHLRVSIGNQEENSRFLDALREVM